MEKKQYEHMDWLGKKFEVLVKQGEKIKRRTHINISELRASLSAESRVARCHPNSRPLIGSDSQVTLGSVVKGRSSSQVGERAAN